VTGANVTVIRKDLEYSWNGVDTNFVLRGRGGMRLSGGTSTGRSVRDTCLTDVDTPSVKGREGNDFAGGTAPIGGVGAGCRPYRPFQTNVRANASYTIPVIDVLAGAVFQYRPGVERSANLTVSNADVFWEPSSASRVGTQFNNASGTPSATRLINLLDAGDLYGEGLRTWDLNFGKNIRFANKRVNVGVNVYNLFNTDAATAYNSTYTAFRQADGSWGPDNPATVNVEVNTWGQVTQIATPRFMRFTVQFDF
jgi:hypothetical protein